MASTVSPHALFGLYALILPKLKTAKNGGIVGDANHGSGYHLSRDALKAKGLTGDYSIQCPADKDGPGNTAAATDITFGSLDELITVHKRTKAACEANDPRMAPIRETIGTLDGKNVSGYNRVATGSGSRSTVGWHPTGWSDKSHLWHIHLSWLRRYVEDTNGVLGVAEVILGLPAGALGWKGEGAKPPVPADPKAFPGTEAFFIGAHGDYVTLLGQRLVAWGWKDYTEGPGPTFSQADKDAVLWFQKLQGWTGASATGIPGPATWARLMTDPKPATPPVTAPPVTTPPVVTPPVVTPPEVPAVSGISTPVTFISLNAQWPEYGSTQAKVKAGTVKAWSSRKKTLASKIKGAKIVAVQELGQSEAAELAAELGQTWSYQRLTLNCVFWRTDAFDYVKTRELSLPAYGQFPGRSYIEVWLKDKKGNRLRVGSTHLSVKTAHDEQYQLDQIEKITSFVNDEDDDWPLVIGVDTNNKQSDTSGMWVRLKQYGFHWDRKGIDAILWNYGVKITRTDRVDLGDGSDHDGRTAPVMTTKK